MTQSEKPSPPAIDRRALLKGAGAASLVVASGGTVPAGAAPVTPPAVPPSTLRAPPPLPPVEVIALNRMGFGTAPGARAAFRALGNTDDERLEAYVEQQLNPESIDDIDLENRLSVQGFVTLDLSLEQLWQEFVVNPGELPRSLPVQEVTRATFLRAVYSKRQLVEALADFWHNHFNVYGWEYSIAPVWVHYDRDVIRRHLLGNFREMLEAVATSPAMLFFLDNHSNTRAGTNENWARELFELHTLGSENYLGVGRQSTVPLDENGFPVGYVDDDVYETTRCFTGWQVDTGGGSGNTGTFRYVEEDHDRFQKRVLALEIPPAQAPLRDGRDVLDRLAHHPGTGRHIARKLCRRFIADDPPERVVAEAAAVFTENVASPTQLREVMRTILLSPEFRTTWGEKVKRPFEAFVSALRATGAEFTPSNNMWWYRQTGHELFAWRAPNGYPDRREDWSSTMPMLQKWRVTNRIIEGVDGIQVDIFSRTPRTATANEVAAHWINLILGRPVPFVVQQEIADFMADGRSPDFPLDLTTEGNRARLLRMVGLILLTPDFQHR